MQKVADLMKKYDHFVPWILLLLIGGVFVVALILMPLVRRPQSLMAR